MTTISKLLRSRCALQALAGSRLRQLIRLASSPSAFKFSRWQASLAAENKHQRPLLELLIKAGCIRLGRSIWPAGGARAAATARPAGAHVGAAEGVPVKRQAGPKRDPSCASLCAALDHHQILAGALKL